MDMWVDPPGVLYAVSYVAASICYSFLIRKSSLRKPERLMSFGVAAALITFMVATDSVPRAWFMPCIAVDVVLLYGIIYFANELTWQKTLYYTAHMYIIGEFCASLEWQLYYFVYGRRNPLHFTPGKICWIMISYVFIYFIIFLVGRRLYHMKADVDISKREAFMTVIIAFVIFVMSNISYVSVNTPFSGELPREIFNIHTLVDLGGLAILFTYHIQLIDVQRKVDFDSMKNILDMQYMNYQVSKQSVDIINRKYHDLKHQIDILRREFGSEKGLQYLDEMQSEIESYEAQNKTGNKILDTILTGKSLYCQQHDIKLTGVADGSLLDFMDMMDISSLFGNAFDNAIESVGAIEDKEKRLIHFTISRNKGFVRIKIENCYAGELDFQNGLPQTTKQDRNYHGYGIKSIKTIVKKYNGSVTIDAKNGWFELRIIIPVLGAVRMQS